MSFMTANQDRCNKNQVFPCSCVSCKIDKEKAKKRKEKKGMSNNNTPNCVFICKGHFPKWMRVAGWKVILQDSFQSSSVWPASKQNKTNHKLPLFSKPCFLCFYYCFQYLFTILRYNTFNYHSFLHLMASLFSLSSFPSFHWKFWTQSSLF